MNPTPPNRNLFIRRKSCTCEAICKPSTPSSGTLYYSTCDSKRYYFSIMQELFCFILFLKHLATLHSVQVFRSTPSDASWTKQSWITTIQSGYLVLITFGWKIYLSASPAYSSCLCLNIGTCLAPVCPYPLGLSRNMSTFAVGSSLQPKKSHHDQVIKSHSWIQLGPVHWHCLHV